VNHTHQNTLAKTSESDASAATHKYKYRLGRHKSELDPKVSTVVTDGNGGMKVHLDSVSDPILHKGLTAHETVHIDQIKTSAEDLSFLQGAPEGRQIIGDVPQSVQFKYEIAGHKAALRVWESQLSIATTSQQAILNEAINNSRAWVHAFENPM
jgi:hypothetical protein